MLPVRITVSVGARNVPLEQIPDTRLAVALRTAGEDIARRLEAIHCDVHATTAANVRVHFGRNGSADLQYDSCCERLGRRIGEVLG